MTDGQSGGIALGEARPQPISHFGLDKGNPAAKAQRHRELPGLNQPGKLSRAEARQIGRTTRRDEFEFLLFGQDDDLRV